MKDNGGQLERAHPLNSTHPGDVILEQYLAAGLPESDALALSAHLSGCSECYCRLEVLKFWRNFD